MPRSLGASFPPCTASAMQPTYGTNSSYFFIQINYAVTFSALTIRKDNMTNLYSWVECMYVDLGWTNRYLATLPLFPSSLTLAHS